MAEKEKMLTEKEIRKQIQENRKPIEGMNYSEICNSLNFVFKNKSKKGGKNG